MFFFFIDFYSIVFLFNKFHQYDFSFHFVFFTRFINVCYNDCFMKSIIQNEKMMI